MLCGQARPHGEHARARANVHAQRVSLCAPACAPEGLSSEARGKALRLTAPEDALSGAAAGEGIAVPQTAVKARAPVENSGREEQRHSAACRDRGRNSSRRDHARAQRQHIEH